MFQKLFGDFSRKFGESFAKALAKDGLPLKARWPKLCGLVVSELADEGEQGPAS